MPEQDVALSTTRAASVRSRPAVRRRLTVILGGLAILVFAFGMVWLQSSKYEPLVVGMTAPNFSLPDLQGKTQRLTDYRGKVVFLNFWATWCKPCKEEMPSMQVLWDNLKNQDFMMLAVSMDRVTTTKDIPSFVETLKLSFPILTDSWGQTDKRYKLMGVPETYIIDQNGVLREKVIGPRDWTRRESIETIVRMLQKQPKSVKAD
ncbi:MAG: redoxin domain-containing protein [Nitrospirae bacterium]|nr:MAG: redoxin domain-containing protein [Nitrospirota bacterium]